MEQVLAALVVLASAGAISVFAWLEGRKPGEGMTAVAHFLGGQAHGEMAEGSFEGVPIRVALCDRGGGDLGDPWTEIRATLPKGYPFLLHVESHRHDDQARVARGEMVDVIIGEPAFDRRFRVEGAPAEVVRRAFSEAAQDYLRRTDRVEIETRNGQLVLGLPDWERRVDRLRPAIACIASIATAVRAASLALDEAIALAPPAEVYRGVADDAPLQEARGARTAEVHRVEQLRHRRRGPSGSDGA